MVTSDHVKIANDYEDVSRYLLESVGELLGLELERVEGKQRLVGDIDSYVVDAKGVETDSGATVVVECKRYPTRKVPVGEVKELAWNIQDTGAAGGIIVTPIGVQAGGALIAQARNIHVVQLDANATTTDFMMSFLGKIVAGRSVTFGGVGTGSAKVEVAPSDDGP